MLKKISTLAAYMFLLFTVGRAAAQSTIAPENLEQLHIMEDSLLATTDSMYYAYIPDTHIYYSEEFAKQLVRALEIPNSFYYPFDKLKDKISILYPEDNAFRIFNWNVVPSAVTRRYYAAVQMPSEQLKLWGLVDYTEALGRNAEDSVLRNHKWFGALYYRIIKHEINGQSIYTMFGVNEASPISTKKVMDPMIINDDGITFGAPIFGVQSYNRPNEMIDRFIMEYKKGVSASLNWDDQLHLVFFDKLVSEVNDPNRKYTYVPSGEYDGFKWENDRWNYVQDLIPVKILKDGEAPSGTTAPDK